MLGYNPYFLSRRRESNVRRAFPSYDDCAYAWVRQLAKNGVAGRMDGGSYRMFFEGPTIYSYGYHFPIAKIIYAGKENAAYVLVNRDRHSVTTSNHQSAVSAAINTYFGERHTTFHVGTYVIRNHSDDDRSPVYMQYKIDFLDAMKSADRQRIRSNTRELLKQSCLHAASEANRFASLFGDTMPFPDNATDAFRDSVEG